MKTLFALVALAALAGCATQPRTVAYGGYPQSADPSQWHVVSVTPVAPGTAERMAAAGTNTTTTTTLPASTPQYASQPVQYSSAPVYVQQPVYVPAPVYVRDPYYDYYPPVSLSLGFVFGNGGWCCHHGGWGRGGIGVGFHR